MTEPRTTRTDAPVNAVANVTALAYRKLRKLPEVVTELTGKAATTTVELRERAGTAGLRERAVAGTAGLRERAVAGTVELRERAVAGTAGLRERAVAGSAGLRDKAAATLRAANATAADLRGKAASGELDADRLRELARRNTSAFVAGAQAAQERAIAVYGALVARGERVVGGGQAADTANADIEATEAPAEVTATPADVAEGAEGKKAPVAKRARPAKRTRPTAAK